MAQIETCSGCQGKGYISCPICNGVGLVAKTAIVTANFKKPEPVECHTCQGTGKRLCKMCEGVGKLLLETPASPWA